MSFNAWENVWRCFCELTSPPRKQKRRVHVGSRPFLERLENRWLPSFNGLAFSNTQGYDPPDTCGAAGQTVYVETVNQRLRIFNKTNGSTLATDNFDDFWFQQGGLHGASGTSNAAFLTDPGVIYDDLANVFIVGDDSRDTTNYTSSTFELAVSKSSSPATLTSADWRFFEITTNETDSNGNIYWGDYPGNYGYNNEAFVFTLDMLPAVSGHGSDHAQVDSLSISGLLTGYAPANQSDVNMINLRPTTMHDSRVENAPMWLVTEGGNRSSIDLVRMDNVLGANQTCAPILTEPFLSSGTSEHRCSELTPQVCRVRSSFNHF